MEIKWDVRKDCQNMASVSVIIPRNPTKYP